MTTFQPLPDPAHVQCSAAVMKALGALSPAEELTPLGRHLTLMPLDPRVGKMLVFGALLRCASPVLTVAAAMGHGRQIFFSPADKRQESQVRGWQPCRQTSCRLPDSRDPDQQQRVLAASGSQLCGSTVT